MTADPSMFQLVIAAFNGLLALFVLLMQFSIKRLVRDLDKNTSATEKIGDELHSLNLAMLGNFVPMKDWEYVRTRLHDLGGMVQDLKTRDELRQRREELEYNRLRQLDQGAE